MNFILMNFRVEYVGPQSGRFLGREAAERATKSREVFVRRVLNNQDEGLFRKSSHNGVKPRLHYVGGIQKRRFHSETHQMFSHHITPVKQKNAKLTGLILDLCLKKTRVRIEITSSSWRHRFSKALFWNCFPSTPNRKTDDFKFLWFKERFRKNLFSRLFSVDGKPNRSEKAAFFSQIPPA